MRIAVKYCGGCNPRYDRPEVVNKLKRDLPGAQIVPAGENQEDYVVVLCGCRSACAQHAHLTGEQGKCVLTSGESYPSLLETLRALPEPADKQTLY